MTEVEVAVEKLIEKEDAAETDPSHPCQIVCTVHMKILDSWKNVLRTARKIHLRL